MRVRNATGEDGSERAALVGEGSSGGTAGPRKRANAVHHRPVAARQRDSSVDRQRAAAAVGTSQRPYSSGSSRSGSHTATAAAAAAAATAYQQPVGRST